MKSLDVTTALWWNRNYFLKNENSTKQFFFTSAQISDLYCSLWYASACIRMNTRKCCLYSSRVMPWWNRCCLRVVVFHSVLTLVRAVSSANRCYQRPVNHLYWAAAAAAAAADRRTAWLRDRVGLFVKLFSAANERNKLYTLPSRYCLNRNTVKWEI